MSRRGTFGEAIFDPGFGMEGPHLVAASAGTGKTHNIQNIYVRLVAEKGLRVAQIQVMTFTEAATKELRDRIRRVLADFSRFLAGDVEGLDANEIVRLGRLRDCARLNVRGASAAEPDAVIRARVELALTEFDQAAISTIHGFCRRTLARFAFETDSAFRAEFADSKAADLTRRVRDWWRVERNRVDPSGRSGLNLATLANYTMALAGKTGWMPKTDGGEDSANRVMLERAGEIVAGYDADRQVRETQTFDDLLRGVADALAEPVRGDALAARLRDEFKAILVDEFQDTDPVQYEIFRRVFLDPTVRPRPSLFFVGDPKQAIYSFRGGDIYTYKRAVENDAVKANAYRLDRNFRSTPRIIDAVNMIFRDAPGPDGRLLRTFGDDSIDYESDLLASDKPALQIAGQDDPKPFRFVWTENAADRDAAVVESVLAALDEQGPNGLTPKDIAVLVTSHQIAAALRDALRERGVPVVLQKPGNVFSDSVADELRVVLQAMTMSGGTGQIRAAMATSFFDFTTEEIAAFAAEGAEAEAGRSLLADMIRDFGELNRIWRKRGFNAAFAALEAHPRCGLRRRFAQEPGGERKLADVFQIVELASAAVQTIGPAPETLVNWLTERINNSMMKGREKGAETDAEEYARQLESESDAVRIMTTHVSKGLQFPVVIVAASDDRSPTAPYFFHEEGRLVVSVDPADAEKAGAEATAESTRLLYVAFTRAVQRTIVVAPKKLEQNGSALARLVANARRNGAAAANSPIAESDFAVTEGMGTHRYTPPEIPQRVLRDAETPVVFSSAPTKGSYSSLAPTAHDAVRDGHDFDAAGDVPDVPEDETHPIFLFDGGAHTGTCWHEILERIPFDCSADAIREATASALRLHGFASADRRVFAERVEVVADMIEKTLGFELVSPTSERFCLRQVPLAERFSEWEFDFSSRAAVARTDALAAILADEWKGDPEKAPFLQAMRNWSREVPHGFFKGFLDLLFRHRGCYYIVDWKSNVLGRRAASFDAAGVRAEMAAEGYFFQYLLYSVVLHRFLRERMGKAYSWERNFGGIRYFFLRGIAAGGAAPVFADRPSERLLDRLADALGLGGAK